MRDITEREKLDLKIRSTIEWHYGSICDHIKQLASEGHFSEGISKGLQQKCRREGNLAINVVFNHLEKVNVTAKPEPIDANKVLRQVAAEFKEG